MESPYDLRSLRNYAGPLRKSKKFTKSKKKWNFWDNISWFPSKKKLQQTEKMLWQNIVHFGIWFTFGGLVLWSERDAKFKQPLPKKANKFEPEGSCMDFWWSKTLQPDHFRSFDLLLSTLCNVYSFVENAHIIG